MLKDLDKDMATNKKPRKTAKIFHGAETKCRNNVVS